MFAIRVVSAPQGEAPKWVNQAWVGLVLNIDRRCNLGRHTVGALGGEPSIVLADGRPVTVEEGLRALRESGPEGERAAEWWETESHLPHCDDPKFFFARDCCELIRSGRGKL